MQRAIAVAAIVAAVVLCRPAGAQSAASLNDNIANLTASRENVTRLLEKYGETARRAADSDSVFGEHADATADVQALQLALQNAQNRGAPDDEIRTAQQELLSAMSRMMAAESARAVVQSAHLELSLIGTNISRACRSAERSRAAARGQVDRRVAGIIDDGIGRDAGHTAIAAWVHEEHGIDGWWAQNVTVGYERITGLRLPYQMADGTFTANGSRTIGVDAAQLREHLLDAAQRKRLFPGIATELRSKPTSKNVRLAIGPGTAEISIEPRADGRAKVTIQHAKLPSFRDVEQWRAYWSEWLDRSGKLG